MTDGALSSRLRLRQSVSGGANGFRGLALVTTAATYLEIVLGGTVRVTGSGEACPDWPACHGRLIPSFSEHVLIEYGHRLAASLVSILVVALLVAALLVWRQPRYLKILSGVALGLLVLQVLLGGVTVLAGLPPQIVTAHLATATALLGVLCVISVYSFTGRGAVRDPISRPVARIAMIVAGGTFLLLLTGSAVVGSDAGLACHTWPLCNGDVFTTDGHSAVEISYFHRVMALLVGFGMIAMGISGFRIRRERRVLFTVTSLAVALYLVQVLVGAGNVWLGLTQAIRVAHLAAAQAVWMVTAALTVLASTAPATPAAAVGEAATQRRLPLAASAGRRARFGDRTRRSDASPERERQ